MNLDSVVRVQLVFNIHTAVADIVVDWDDGEIADLLEDDPDAIEAFREDAIDYALEAEAEAEELEVDNRPI